MHFAIALTVNMESTFEGRDLSIHRGTLPGNEKGILKLIQSYSNPQEAAPISILRSTALQIMKPTMIWDLAEDLIEVLSEIEILRLAAVRKIQSESEEHTHLKNTKKSRQKYLSCVYYIRSMHLHHSCTGRSPDTGVLLRHFPNYEPGSRPFNRYSSTLSSQEWDQYGKEAGAMHAAFRVAMEAAKDHHISDKDYAKLLIREFGDGRIDWIGVVNGYLEQAKISIEYAGRL
ncbi:uncharacterized protein EI90DRAFT_1018563 [Cantharellus anzutake]|uniref:uncharacterized protein n=1 Tax=Cantharellus anzutake TaxID=1750568 RepID=UPI0019083D31|nr:uncharacterized protein EI90DRAFT_1018563 [Cantharellus anzutake]KAF8331402.1 hypothetical protein EI90DRAFT_1018563 [Cantharellus anzutake]